jgi:CheY-like chemotaxis protein
VPLSYRDGVAQPPLRILVVDEYADAAVSTGELLKHLGHDVCVSMSAEHALQRVTDWIPRVALIDVHMKRMDGYAFAARLRSSVSQPITLIALTSLTSDILRARTDGCDHHLMKPFELNRLIAILAGID